MNILRLISFLCKMTLIQLFRKCQRIKSLSPLAFFLLYLFLRAVPTAYGHSQARAWIRAAATSLCHSHSNTRSLTHWASSGIKPASSWILVGLLTRWATTGIPCQSFIYTIIIIIIIIILGWLLTFSPYPKIYDSIQ